MCALQIAKMALHHHRQQVVTVNSSYIRAVVIKCINVTLMMLAVFSVLVSTASHLASYVTATRCA